MTIREERERGTNMTSSLGTVFFATDHEMCELPVIFSTLLNAAEYVMMDFNKPCPAWSGRAAVKWLKLLAAMPVYAPRTDISVVTAPL